MSDQGSVRGWKAFAGSVRAQFTAPTDRDLDRLLGRRHKLAARLANIAESELERHLVPPPVQEPARI